MRVIAHPFCDNHGDSTETPSTLEHAATGMERAFWCWQTLRTHLSSGQNMTISEGQSELDSRIVELVRNCWNEHQMPLLLSRLGGEHNGDIAREAKERAGSLGAYLRERLHDRVRVIQHSTKPPLIGAIPSNVDTDGSENVDTLLNRTHGHTVQATRRFHPAFWAGFRKPLPTLYRRYMSLQEPVRFQDVPDDRRPPSGFVEVQRNHVVGPDADAAKVQQEIEEWFEENALEPTSFLAGRTVENAQPPPNDLLGRLLLALDPDDLKRLSMPLDIVNKLRRHPL